jgi:uncharacterized protein YukE
LPDFPDFDYDEKLTSDKEISMLQKLAKQIKENSKTYEDHDQNNSQQNLMIT